LPIKGKIYGVLNEVLLGGIAGRRWWWNLYRCAPIIINSQILLYADTSKAAGNPKRLLAIIRNRDFLLNFGQGLKQNNLTLTKRI
jgi:hypothetical protein